MGAAASVTAAEAAMGGGSRVPPPPRAVVLALAVVAFGTVAATIGSQAVGLAAPDLAGAFRVSANEASWIGTVTTMAEVAAVPIIAVLIRPLTLRRVALAAAAVHGLAALLSLVAPDLAAMLVLRALQGFTGGFFPVLMMVVVMATLPPGPWRGAGLAAFGLASSLPSALAATVAGAFTDAFGWRGLFLYDLAWVVPFLALAWTLLPRQPAAPGELARVDWPGYALLAAGLAALVMVLTQGERRFWFESPLIVGGTLAAVPLLALAALWMLARPRPLLDLRLLARPTFGWAIVVAVSFRFGLLVSTWVVPQALSRLQGFRPPEVGEATLWIGLAHLVCFPLSWWYATRVNARHTLCLGLLLFAAAALMNAFMTADWHPAQFVPSLLVMGAGQSFFIVAVLLFATSGLRPEQGPTAAGLFNLSRVVGQALGVALVSTLVTEREKYHSSRLVEELTAVSPQLAERLDALRTAFLATHADRSLADLQALSTLASTQSRQAFLLAFNDAFLAVAAVLLVSAYLVLMLPRLPTDDRPVPGPAPTPRRAQEGTSPWWPA
jgi:MFS transporter, DHA2 family, multidrug resistance protein